MSPRGEFWASEKRQGDLLETSLELTRQEMADACSRVGQEEAGCTLSGPDAGPRGSRMASSLGLEQLDGQWHHFLRWGNLGSPRLGGNQALCCGPAKFEMLVGQPGRAAHRAGGCAIQSSVGAPEAHVGLTDLDRALKIFLGPDVATKKHRLERTEELSQH